jgi:ABC-2 type transport system permease protein
MQKTVDIAINDLILNFRSLFAVGMMFVAPLLITGLIFFAFGGSGSSTSIQPIHVVIANLDVPAGGKPSIAQSMVDMMTDSSVSNWLKATPASDESNARSMVERQQAGAAIIIPANFTRTINRGRGAATIEIIQDPTLSIGPAVVKNMVEMYLDGINGFRILVQLVSDNAALAQKPFTVNTMLNAVEDYKDWYKKYQDSLFHSEQNLIIQAPAAGSEKSSGGLSQLMGTVLAGQMLFFAFYTGAYAMMSILREQEQGTLARLFTTPTGRLTILSGKFLSVFVMVLVQSVVMLSVGALAFGVQWGQPASILLMVLGQVAAAGGLGVLLISFVKTSKQAGPVLGAGLTLLGMLGGLFTSNVQMPEAFTRLALFTPQGWAISGWKLAIGGAPAAEMAGTFAVLLLSGLSMFTVGSIIFRRRFAS